MVDIRVEDLTYMGRGAYNFMVAGGECLGISGASGAGKSLLLRAIADLLIHDGEIFLDDMACSQIAPGKWRRMVSLLPAESFWWQDRVAEHFVDFAAVDEESMACLGFDYSVGDWQLSRLSSGEKQRLALLRVLENKPSALLLDEPTASLDSKNAERLERFVLDYSYQYKAPLLWVSHSAEQLARVADKRAYMDKHAVLEWEA